jgi:hypothetical protein
MWPWDSRKSWRPEPPARPDPSRYRDVALQLVPVGHRVESVVKLRQQITEAIADVVVEEVRRETLRLRAEMAAAAELEVATLAYVAWCQGHGETEQQRELWHKVEQAAECLRKLRTEKA